MKTRVGSFNTGLGAAATTVVLTGFGFTPVAGKSFVMFWWNGRTEVVNTVGNASHRRGSGISTGPSVNFSSTSKSKTGVLADTASDSFNGRCVYLINASTDTEDGSMHVQSFDADGITLVIDNDFGQSFTVHYKAYDATDIESASYGIITEPGATGTVSYTFPGRRPDALIAIGTPGLVSAAIQPDSRFMQGFASFANNAIQQITMAGGSDDALALTQTINYGINGQFLSQLDTGLNLVTTRGRVTAQNADGFDITWDEVSGLAREFQILAISGGQWMVGGAVSVAAGNNITVTGVPFTPRGYMLISTNRTESASDTPSSPDEWALGAVDNSANQMSMTIEDADNLALAVVVTAVQFDSVLATTNGVSAIDSRITHTSFNADGFTMAQPISDGAGRWIGYLAEGDANPPSADSTQTGQNFGKTQRGLSSRRDI